MGGVKETKYLLKIRNHAPSTTHYAPRKTKNSVPPLFFEKAGDNKKRYIRMLSAIILNVVLGFNLTHLCLAPHKRDIGKQSVLDQMPVSDQGLHCLY